MDTTAGNNTKRLSIAAFAAALLSLWMFGAWLGRVELLNPDEARHAEIARELLAQDSWLVPHLQGVPYYDKPIALHALIATSLSAFGASEAAVRLPSAAGALIVLASLAAMFRARGERLAAVLATVGLCTTGFFLALGRYAVADMPLTAAMTAAFCSLGTVWCAPRPRSALPAPALVLFYAAIAVATLIKGPVALAIAAVAVALLAAADRSGARGPERVRSFRPVLGLAIVACLAVPWYLAAWRSEPVYIETFLWGHNIARFFSAAPGYGHGEPWWYYLVGLPLALAPWTLLVAAAAAHAIRRIGRSESETMERFLLCWAAAVLAVFLPARAKLVTYLLPALPPLIALAALRVARLLERPSTSIVARGDLESWAIRSGYAAAAVAVVAFSGATVYLSIAGPEIFASRAWLTMAATAVVVLLYTRLRHADLTGALAITASLMLLLHAVVYGMAVDVVGHYKGQRSLAGVLEADLEASVDLRTFRAPPHAATFYTGRIVPHIDNAEDVWAFLSSGSPTALVVRRRHLKAAALEVPEHTRTIWTSPGGLLLIVNRGTKRSTAFEEAVALSDRKS